MSDHVPVAAQPGEPGGGLLTKIIIFGCFLLLIGIPLVVQPEGGAAAVSDDAPRVIILTPHNEQIRAEFSHAFTRWHEQMGYGPVRVEYRVPGGTNEIRKMLQAQFTSALERGRDPGGSADLVFGGGSYEFGVLKRGVSVDVGGVTRTVSILAPPGFTDDEIDLPAIFGDGAIGDALLLDPDGYWFGTALSGFGIVYNRDALRVIGVSEPAQWEDLCDPRYLGWLALVNPLQSGSITSAFHAILQHEGWERGWAILRRMAANARYFSGSSLKPPADVLQGDAAAGVCIDFYGRFQMQAVRLAGDAQRLQYIDPPGGSIDADPIAMLYGAPNPEVARRFIRFTLSPQGQALWQLYAQSVLEMDCDGGVVHGPRTFELRRLPVRADVYAPFAGMVTDEGVDPFVRVEPARYVMPASRTFLAPLFAAMAIDNHSALQRAWRRIITHPAYPQGGGIVMAGDVSDPHLRAMLLQFDALPAVDAPGGERRWLGDPALLPEIRAGWMEGGWRDAELWHREDDPAAALRRDMGRFFRARYAAVMSGGA